MEQNHDYQSIKTFADVCTAMGKDEQNYNVEAATTNEDKADICLKRVKLIAKAINGPQKLNLADTTQLKYGIWVWVNPDTDSPAGFRLSFFGCIYDFANARLGARPLFADGERGEYAFHQFQAEFEQQMQYEALALME